MYPPNGKSNQPFPQMSHDFYKLPLTSGLFLKTFTDPKPMSRFYRSVGTLLQVSPTVQLKQVSNLVLHICTTLWRQTYNVEKNMYLVWLILRMQCVFDVCEGFFIICRVLFTNLNEYQNCPKLQDAGLIFDRILSTIYFSYY